MKFRLISDSHDALTGMRLSGIEGVFAKTAQEAEEHLKECIDDETVGIVLITERLAAKCPGFIDKMKLEMGRPLVVTIPGSKHEEPQDNIMRYVREAIGIKI